jgi:orotidine 5'-phosphate decarboxylase subfamily 2
VFRERVLEAQRQTRSRVCVGLDPHSGATAEARAKIRRVIDETAAHACAYKPNSAFFEAFGAAGMDLLAEAIAWIHDADRVCILDAKRGDIASTAEAYARAAFDVLDADAITVIPYMGEDAIRPFLARGRAVFIVALPSGLAAARIVEHGTPPLFLHVGELAVELSEEFPGQVGLVVGATRPEGAAALHRAAPGLAWLVPGLGAQGGDLEAFERAAPHDVVLYNVSRGIFADVAPGEAAKRWKEQVGWGGR